MRPRDVFGIVVRTVGLLTLMSGVFTLGVTVSLPEGPRFWTTVAPIVVGAYLLRGAPPLLAWSYAPPRPRRSRRRGQVSHSPMHAESATPPR